MKYKLPGIYLGNIALDLFMEYMNDADLTNQTTSNDYYQTTNRTDNIQVYKVEFTYPETEGVDYKFYTHNIMNENSIREMIRAYFKDIISTDPDYDSNVDAITFTSTFLPYDNDVIFYDTLSEPSIYGTHMRNYLGEEKYMISVLGDSNEDLNSYADMRSYVDTKLTESEDSIEVKICDLRYDSDTPEVIKTLYVDVESLKEQSVRLLEFILDDEVIQDVYEYSLFFGNKSLLNYIGNNKDEEGVFFFKDKLGGLTTSPYKNVMMTDIENNRKILDESIQLKMITGLNSDYFKGIAGIVKTQRKEIDKVDLIFSKYDKYNITKTMEKIASLPSSVDPIYEDLQPKTMSEIGDTSYDYNSDSFIIYKDLINTGNLPKFKAIFTNDIYYIFDKVKGEVPLYRGSNDTSDDPSLCLLDVYTDMKIKVSANNQTKEHKLNYELSPVIDNKEYVYRTVTFGETPSAYYVKLVSDENDLSGYVIMTSNSNSFETASDVLASFDFEGLGITVSVDDIYKSSISDDGVDRWSMDIYMSEEEKLTVELQDVANIDSDLENLSSFVDISTLQNKVYFKMPIILDMSDKDKTEDVMVTLRTKEVISANDEQSDAVGYWTSGDSADYTIEKPVFTEYEADDSKPFNNISSYLSLNEFTESEDHKSYQKTYYIINKYDQSKIYKVIELLEHEYSSNNQYPYDNTFYNLNSKIEDDLHLNNINDFVSRLENSLEVTDRGKLIDSDIMGTDLVDSISDDFREGFNKLFYNIGNYEYDYTSANLSDKQKLDFLKNSLFGFDSLNKLITAFLRYNFVSTNEFMYTLDSNFRMGFFVKKNTEDITDNKMFVNWIDSIPINELDANNMSSLQRIKNYEDLASDEDISNKAKINWIKNHLLYSGDGSSVTEYAIKKKYSAPLKNINNKEIVSQAFDMVMDQRYNATKVIESFANTNITKLVIVDSKDKDQFSATSEPIRFINSNQRIDVMINAYLNGFDKKVGD